MYAYFDSHVKPGVYLSRLMASLDLCASPRKCIGILSHMLGKVLPEGLPPKQTQAHFESIRNRLDRVSVKTRYVHHLS